MFQPLWAIFRSQKCTGLFKMIVEVLTTCHTQYTSDRGVCILYLTEQHSKFLLHTLQVLYICTLCGSTGLFEMIVGVLTTCHTQCTSDISICTFLFNKTTLQVFVTYLTGALYVHPLWFYRIIRNDCRGFNNLSYTMHFRYKYMYFLFNKTTLQVFVTYLTGALYVHPLWFYRVIRYDYRGFNNLSYTIRLK